MSNSTDNFELSNFYQALCGEIKSIQATDDEGGSLEQIFTRTAVDLLAEAGETENVRVAYDEKALGTKNQHKINAYSISDNYETLDLFICIFKGTDEPSKVAKDEIDTAAKRINNFLRKAVEREYVNEIEESSEIFQFASTLSRSTQLKESLVRLNVIILTDGLYNGNVPSNATISDYPIYYRVIDLNYLFNISEKSHIPIEIDFEQEGYQVPCITIPIENEHYKSYLAIIPGKLLASIYERYGSRLLEQNVRSFLQFTGNINKGIRSTIQSEPEMFLAYNNGIAATAEETVIKQAKNGQGLFISKIKDLQIVNGGQTTASIFHTLKKDRADISGIFVQLKLTVVKDRTNFSQIVSNISRYANTQNKVSISDLSANHPSLIQLEKLSRLIYAPHLEGNSTQTRWFFERARGQYKNERAREGRTKAKLHAFESQNPSKHLFTKEDLAKYLNSYSEVSKGNKIFIGPHIVVRGSQKNHKAFVDFNLPDEIDNIYFEDVVAKMIVFRAAEKIYGVKPNAIGDLRFITVPYAISYMVYVLKHPIDLYKIWKKQDISEKMKDELRTIMIRVEEFIKVNAPGSLYTEFAKKEDCWSSLKASRIGFDISAFEDEIIDPQNPPKRRRMNPEQLNHMEEHYLLNQITLPTEKWKQIIQWGQHTGKLNLPQIDRIHNYLEKQVERSKISGEEILCLIEITERVNKYAPEILESLNEQEQKSQEQIFVEQASHCLEWIKATKHTMNATRYNFIKDITKGKIVYSFENKTTLSALIKDLIEFGYEPLF